MSELEITDLTVTLRLSTLEKVGAVHGDLSVPRSSVRSAVAVPDAWQEVHGIRAPGYGMPGHAMLGTWRTDGGKDFVDVRHGDPGVVVELDGQDFARIVLSLPTSDEAQAVARRLGQAGG